MDNLFTATLRNLVIACHWQIFSVRGDSGLIRALVALKRLEEVKCWAARDAPGRPRRPKTRDGRRV